MSKAWCFFGVHEWQVIRTGRVVYMDYGRPTGAYGTYYDMRCRCCGKIKSVET